MESSVLVNPIVNPLQNLIGSVYDDENDNDVEDDAEIELEQKVDAFVKQLETTLGERLIKRKHDDNEADDEGTATLVSDMIKLHEKNSWMFRAWLK